MIKIEGSKDKMIFLGLSAILLLFSTSCSRKIIYPAPNSIVQDTVAKLSKEKQLAYQFVTSQKTDESKMNLLLADDFQSFDKYWNGDREGFISNRNSDYSFFHIKPVRILEDQSIVAIQSRMLGDSLRFRWDIMRIENQKIQQHWSNIGDSIGLNPDGHTEIDGPTIPENLGQTDTNRALVRQFIDQCMIREDGGAAKFFNFRLYIQHNRDVGDGLNGLLWGMLKMKVRGDVIKFKHNYHIIAEGNFVLSCTEGYVGETKTVFYDLFRIEENKIVEHWDIIAPVDEFIYYQLKTKKNKK